MKILFSICCLLLGVNAFGQKIEERVVQQFGSNLQGWCSTKDTDYRLQAQKLCTEACRVEDKIMQDFTLQNNLDLRNYVIQSYLNGFETALDNGNISLEFRNIESISPTMWAFDKSTTQKKGKLTEDYVIIKCNVVVKGALNYDIHDTYYVSKGFDAQIVKITPFEEILDNKTGEKKVRVDFSRLEKRVKQTQKAYPMQVSRGIIALKQYIDGNSLITLNEVDSRLASFESIKSRAGKMKSTFLGMYCLEPALFKKASLVIDCDMQIVERYVNKQTQDVFDIVMTKEDLVENIYSLYFKSAHTTSLNDIVLKNVSEWKKSFAKYLKNYPRYSADAKDFENSNQIFLLGNEIDRKYERIMRMPIITISLINESTGSKKKIQKSIKDFYPYICSLEISNVRIEVPKIDVYIVDALDVRRANGMDNPFNNPFYMEHIFAKNSYILVNDKYEQVKRESVGNCIGRGRSMDVPFRLEDEILKSNGVLTIFGDAEVILYHKR